MKTTQSLLVGNIVCLLSLGCSYNYQPDNGDRGISDEHEPSTLPPEGQGDSAAAFARQAADITLAATEDAQNHAQRATQAAEEAQAAIVQGGGGDDDDDGLSAGVLLISMAAMEEATIATEDVAVAAFAVRDAIAAADTAASGLLTDIHNGATAARQEATAVIADIDRITGLAGATADHASVAAAATDATVDILRIALEQLQVTPNDAEINKMNQAQTAASEALRAKSDIESLRIALLQTRDALSAETTSKESSMGAH